MVASEEIRRVLDRWLTAAREADADAFVGRFSAVTGVRVIGTDEDEWWDAEDAPVWRRQLEEAGGFPFAWDEVEAWEEGTVGWAGARLMMAGPEHDAPIRLTWVLHLEQGEWRIVQAHFSGCRTNVELLGKELTVSLEQLEETVRRERPDLSGSLAADGTVTIVFTDIVDSTVMTRTLGDHAWLDALRRHNQVIRETTGAHGGTVVETQGDGSMLAFASARRAVTCAKAIQAEMSRAFLGSAPIRVRIGIHTGDVLHEADHFYGTTVHYAARVASNADGGEILVSNLVRELVAGSGIDFRDSREVEFKGLDGTHTLHVVKSTN